jgi:hypothetical protein
MSLPPPPAGDPSGSFSWIEWFRKLQLYLTSTGKVPWNVVDKTGSNLSDLATRNHNNLNNIDGGGTAHLQTYLTGSISYDFSSVSAHTTSTTTTTISGAATGQKVILGYSSAPESGMVFDAWVSSADTITIRATNTTAASIDPASRTYYILVLG